MHLVISRCQFDEDAKRLCPSKIDIARCKQLKRSFASFSSTDTNFLDPIKKVEQKNSSLPLSFFCHCISRKSSSVRSKKSETYRKITPNQNVWKIAGPWQLFSSRLLTSPHQLHFHGNINEDTIIGVVPSLYWVRESKHASDSQLREIS